MVVIEIIGAEGKVPRFERPTQAVIRIGRALDNDVIIDDPYIDPHHIVVDVSDPGAWHVTDLDSRNGTSKGHGAVTEQAIESGDELLIGKTRVRFFRVDHQVPAARSLNDLEHRLLAFNSVPSLVLLMIALAALPCLALYLNSAGTDIKLDRYVMVSTSLLGSTILVAGFWALIARLLRGESRFRVLFNITMLLALVSALLRPTVDVLAYNFPGSDLAAVANILVTAVLGGLYVYVVLLLSTRLSSPLSQIVAVIIATGTLATYAIDEYSAKDDFRPYPQYDGTVYAPPFLLRQGDRPADFRKQLPDVFNRADEIAAEETAESD